VVHTFHGHTFHSYFGPLKTRLFITIETALARLTDRIIAVGAAQRQDIVSYGVAPAEKIEVIPLGLPIEEMLHAEERRGQLRADLNVHGSERLVGIVARLVPIKAHEVFFEAAALVRNEEPNTRFVVVGDGDRRAELQDLTRTLGLDGATHFLGWRKDMATVYADLDVVALSSNNEGSPVALIEALAAARPVVSTNVGGVKGVVDNARTGLLVPPRDPRALADSILRLLRNPDEAAAFGAAGRASVYPRHSAGRLVDDVERLYLDLAREKGLAA
jgi:glycosyltransferase involved in cell wall biosynthesis